MCQYVVKLLTFCWITGGLIIRPPIEALLPLTGTTVPNFSLQTIRLHYLHATATLFHRGTKTDQDTMLLFGELTFYVHCDSFYTKLPICDTSDLQAFCSS